MAKKKATPAQEPPRLQTWHPCSRCGKERTGRECLYCEGVTEGLRKARALIDGHMLGRKYSKGGNP